MTKSKRKAESMVIKSLYFPPSLWEAAMEKSGIIPLAVVIRALIKMWVDGEIEVKYTND